MNENEQIEEMANIIRCKAEQLPRCPHTTCSVCKATELYTAGYRKASEVVLETVDDFQSRLRNIFIYMCDCDDYNTLNLLQIDSAIETLFDSFVAKLKKKYTEGEK